jgi:serine/threonine protein kinase
MGTVWSAVHTVTHRAVAMKFLKDTVGGRSELRQRFLREASAASALKHPKAVEILDVFDFRDSSPVMVMELLQGETLGSKLARQQRLSMEETAAILLPVVSAVGTAHALGIVHRDLKPDNLFLEERADGQRVKVLDFGIAKLTAEYYLSRDLSALHTDAGSMLGTPYYMAPEQASGESSVDHRADVWSLGVILYECLSGVRPIEGENMPQVISRLMSAGIIPIERLAPELPHEVSAIVMQMLSRDPGRRPDGLRELSKVLARYARESAPEFADPLRERGSLLPRPPAVSTRPRARVVASGDADPQGPTMISAPPVNQSLNLARQPVAERRVGVYVLGGVAIGACLVWFLLAHKSSSLDAEHPASVASTSASAPPTPAIAAASALATPPSEATAPTSSSPALAKARPLGTPAPTAKLKAGAKLAPGPKHSVDEDTLFSGRK